MTKTRYGEKEKGRSRFLLIAPHAAGDDLKTGLIAKRLAEELRGFLVVNNKYIKPNNSRAKQNPRRVEDFNDLCWGTKSKKYFWKKKKPAMKVFYEDIAIFCDQARELHKKKPIAVYVHGFNSDGIGIDIGAGARNHNGGGKIYGSRRHKETGDNTGEISVKIKILKRVKKDLEKKLKKDFDLGVTVGEEYSGWSKQSGIQFHRNVPQDEYSIQFEINQQLREPQNLKYTINLLKTILQKNFS